MVTLYPTIRNDKSPSSPRVNYPSNSVPPNFDEVMKQLNPLPSASMLLGVCEDGYPLILDFEYHEAGAVLIASDNWYGSYQHLDRMLRSAYILNPSEEINIHLISQHSRKHADLIQEAITGQVFNPYDTGSRILVEELTRLANDRQQGMDPELIQILAVDELDLLINEFDETSIKQFQWLVRNGPSLKIWVVATLSSGQMNRKHTYLLDFFKTKAFGRIESPTESIQLTGKPFVDLSRQFPGVESIVRYQNVDTKVIILQM